MLCAKCQQTNMMKPYNILKIEAKVIAKEHYVVLLFTVRVYHDGFAKRGGRNKVLVNY